MSLSGLSQPGPFRWTELPPLAFPRDRPVAIALEDGRVLVAARCGTVWSPDSGWRERKDLPPEVLSADFSHWTPAPELVDASDRLVGVRGIAWDEGTAEFRVVDRLPARPATGSIILADGTSLTIGGSAHLPGDLVASAMGGGVLKRPGASDIALKMHVARGSGTLTPLPARRVMVTGGYDTEVYFFDRDRTVPIGQVEIVDLTTGAVITAGRLAQPSFEHATAVLGDGSVFIAGGVNATRPSSESAEIGTPQKPA